MAHQPYPSPQTPSFSNVYVCHVIDDVITTLAHHIRTHKIETTIDVPPGAQMDSDVGMLRFAMLNLTQNAIESMPDGGELVLTVCIDGKGVELEVADSGPGIHEVEKNSGPSNQPALEAVQRLVKANGGRLTACNCPEGGAAYTLFLPNGRQRAAAALKGVIAMEPFRQTFSTFVQQFRSLSPRAKWTVGLLLLVLVVSLPYTISSSLAGPDVFLMNGEAISTGQLPGMEAAFARQGLDQYLVENNRIKVPRRQKNKYMAALADAGALPPNFGDILDEALQSNIFDDPRNKAERIKNAKQRELALIISDMKGMEKAMVLYDVQPSKSLGREDILTASVSVKPAGSQELSLHQARAVRNLVASAIAGLEPRQVSVTDLNTGRSYAPRNADDYLDRKQMIERQWTERILAGLSWVPGILANVDVLLEKEDRQPSPATPSPATWAVEHIQVTLSVPDSYLEQLWRQKNHVPSAAGPVPRAAIAVQEAESTEEIKRHVTGLVPRENANTPLDVQLTYFEALENPAAGSTFATGSLSGWRNSGWGLVVLSLLVVVGLLALRRFTLPSREELSTVPAGRDADETESLHPALRTESISGAQATRIDATTVPPHEFSVPLSAGPVVEKNQPPSGGRLVPDRNVAGIELNDLTSSRLALDTPGDAPSQISGPPAGRPFEFINEADPAELTDLLLRENAQIIAIVFSHLDATRAAEVLKRLPTSLQVDVVRRLSNLDELSDQIVAEIEEGLETRLTTQLRRAERRNAGIKAVGDILAAAGTTAGGEIIRQLDVGNADLVEKLQMEKQPSSGPQPLIESRREETIDERAEDQSATFTFEDVIKLDDETLRNVLNAADPQVAILALAGATHEVVDRLITKMNPVEADRLQQALNNLGPTRLSDVELSQQQLAGLASQLQADGKLDTRQRPRAFAMA